MEGGEGLWGVSWGSEGLVVWVCGGLYGGVGVWGSMWCVCVWGWGWGWGSVRWVWVYEGLPVSGCLCL